MKQYNLAIVGASSIIGEELVTILEQRDFPVKELQLFATEGEADTTLTYKGKDIPLQRLSESSFDDIDIAFFASGMKASQQFAPLAVKSGTIVIDTTAAFRMKEDVPLIVPEVNPHIVPSHQGILANPGCSAIQLAVVLRPIQTKARIKRVVVTTYQSVSETGREAIEELDKQIRSIFNHRDIVCQVYPHQIAFNCLPHIGSFLIENDYTQEEMNLINETKKILNTEEIGITATAVRVPMFFGHSLSVNIETEKSVLAAEIGYLLDESPGIRVVDEPENNLYPLASDVVGEDEVFVGRIRDDESVENGLDLWISADNLRKGSALNAVQIAEILIWNG